MTTPADGVEVKLGADTAPATAGISTAASSIAASLKGIQDALANFSAKNKDAANSAKDSADKIKGSFGDLSATFDRFKSQHSSVITQAVANNANLSRSFIGLTASANAGFNSFAGVVERIRGVLGTLTAILAGGLIGKESVRSLTEMSDAVRALEISFGLTAEKATTLAVQLKLAGVSAQEYEGMAFRVGRVLKTQSDEFDRLGVVTKDAAGNLLPMDQILQNIFTRMQDFKAGTDQTEFALSTVGRNAQDFASDMLRLNAVTERAAELQHSLGIEMGPTQQADVERYKIELNAFKITLEEIGVRIGEVLLPNLERLAQWFTGGGIDAINVIVGAVKVFATVLTILGDAANLALRIFQIFFRGLWDVAGILYNVGERLAALDFRGAANAAKLGWDKLVADAKASVQAIVDYNSDATDRINLMWANLGGKGFGMNDRGGASSGAPIKSGNLHFTPKPQAGSGEDDSLIAGLENELKYEQDAYNKKQLLQGSFQTWSIEQTRDYWKNVLDQLDLSVNDRMAAENKYYDAERALQIQAFQAYIADLDAQIAAQGKNINAKIALAQKEYGAEVQRYGAQSAQAADAYKKIALLRQQLAEQVIRIAQLQAAREESIAQHDYDMANLTLTQQVALRQISADQQYAIQSQLEDKLYASAHAALEKERADAEGDVVKQQEIDNKLLALDQQYQTKKTQIANAAELERKQYALQAAQAVQDAFATFLSDITTRSKSFGQAFKDLINGINQELVKLASQQLAKQFLGPGTEGGNFLNNIFSKIFGGGSAGADTGAKGANAGAAAADASLTQLSTAATTASTSLSAQLQTAVTTVATTMQTALQVAMDALTAAANQAAAALAAVGGGGGGLGSLFGGGGFGGGAETASIASDTASFFGFADGTPYVPRDMLAFVHKGESITPAKMNKPGAQAGKGMQVIQNFVIGGDVDQRSQGQISAAAARGLAMAQRRHL